MLFMDPYQLKESFEMYRPTLYTLDSGIDVAQEPIHKIFTKKFIGPILFLYYEESLVLSNLNSNLLRFHCAHPTIHLKTFL